jgi:hypothetical protein
MHSEVAMPREQCAIAHLLAVHPRRRVARPSGRVGAAIGYKPGMGGVRRFALSTVVVAAAGIAAGCGEAQTSPDRVEAQIEHQMRGKPQFVECNRSAEQPNSRYTCRVETSSDRFRYVATCPAPGQPCVIRRTGADFK